MSETVDWENILAVTIGNKLNVEYIGGGNSDKLTNNTSRCWSDISSVVCWDCDLIMLVYKRNVDVK